MQYCNYFYCNNKSQIKEIYEKSFPKEERFPFWILVQCAKENNVHLYAILNEDNPNEVIGMYFTVEYDNIQYLMYLAIDEAYRNKEYGSKVLKDLIIRN